MKVLSHLGLILLAPLLFAAPVRAEDDASDLLRLGKVAIGVEHDAEKGIELLRRVVALDPSGPAGAEALWAIATLQESRKRTSEALDALRTLTVRFSDTMTETRKREVHDALLRLLPPGTREETPLGTLYIAATPADATPGVSPLARKIHEMFDRYEGIEGTARSHALGRLRQSIEAVGADALPILDAITRKASPTRASLAAQLMAEVGRGAALPRLVDLVKTGDPFTRQAALAAFRYLSPRSDLASPDVVAAIDTLLGLDLSEDQSQSLRNRLSSHLTPDERLARHLKGGEHAAWWLGLALRAKAEGALDRALALIRVGGLEGRQAVALLAPLILPSGNEPSVYPVDTLGADDAGRALDLLLAEDWTGRTTVPQAMASLARLIERSSGPEAGTEASDRVWRCFSNVQNRSLREAFVDQVGRDEFTPSDRLLGEPTFGIVLFDTLGGKSLPYGVKPLAQTVVSRGEPFWKAFFASVPGLEIERARNLVHNLQSWLRQEATGQQLLPPAAFDRSWVDLLTEVEGLVEAKRSLPAYVWNATARSGDPRYLDLLRKWTLDKQWAHAHMGWLQTLRDYDGPGRIAFVEESLADPKLPANYARTLLYSLREDPSPEARDLMARIAGDWAHPLARTALGTFRREAARGIVLDIVERVRPVLEDVPSPYRSALIARVSALRLREAVPYLLDEFRLGDLAKTAADAMDTIRSYYQRLETFEQFVKNERADAVSAPQRRLASLLEDEDATIRRAAAIALGALGQTDVLDRLVLLAKEDPDEAVRKAALEAIERIAATR